jgi:hypothetical protein
MELSNSDVQDDVCGEMCLWSVRGLEVDVDGELVREIYQGRRMPLSVAHATVACQQ